MSHKLPHKGASVPRDYIDDMLHYIPNLPLGAVKDAWMRNATPAEVMAHMERIRIGGEK